MDRRNRVFSRRWKLLGAVRFAIGALVLAALSADATAPYPYIKLAGNSGVIQAGGPVYLNGCLGLSRAAGTVYIQFFNSNTVPTNGTAPDMTALKIAATSAFSWDAGSGISRPFTTGLSWGESSTDNTYTAVGGTDIDISCQYNGGNN